MKIASFMKDCDLSEGLKLIQIVVTNSIWHNKNLSTLTFVVYKSRDYLSF